MMDKKYFGLTRRDVRSIAFQLAKLNNIPNPFSLLSESAGKDWLKRFLKRHEHVLSVRKPTGTSIARATGFCKHKVAEFFDILENLMDEKKFQANRIYNVDESGLCIVQSKCPHVISVKGKRQVGALTSAERGSLITVVLSMNTAGNFVPPMIIFPRKKGSEQLKKGAPPGTIFRFHPSGWIQSNLFTDWFNQFIDFTQPSENNPVLLILDGHYSHTRNLDVILKAREKHVTILCLPPKTTHKLQPLDKTVMSALKTYYSEEIRIFLRANQRAVTHFDISELFGRAYLKVQTGERAVKGFAVTGLYPVRRNVFTEDDYLAAEDNSEHKETEDEPVLREQIQNEETSPGSETLVLPEDIMKIPNLKKKQSNRGRKSGKAKIITSTPNKDELEASISISNNKKKEVKRNLANPCTTSSRQATSSKGHPSKRQKKLSISSSESSCTPSVHDSSDDENDISIQNTSGDASCIFCEGKFSEDVRGEVWVRCEICNNWAHAECGGVEKKDIYICDLCK
ncbi:unnamed protein product [Acanthoscelides obtectus]|uniref:HTH CENPB-type domain-containing protein n=2 Tax=Acanthoscelides obtectus TaxID=200917 RepID=A0A9P0P0A3_ACAOB|nr:unnamed protein product [Acanthoscelides obtectus]CAK1648666.1 Tigger transposable element-derived protein 1 [Acanthoscelides obtectus]